MLSTNQSPIQRLRCNSVVHITQMFASRLAGFGEHVPCFLYRTPSHALLHVRFALQGTRRTSMVPGSTSSAAHVVESDPWGPPSEASWAKSCACCYFTQTRPRMKRYEEILSVSPRPVRGKKANKNDTKPITWTSKPLNTSRAY